MSESELKKVFENWPQGQPELIEMIVNLKEHLLAQPGVAWELISRPGVSHSLRFSLEGGKRPLFVMVDAAYLSADLLTLSVCFYADQVDDPDETGDEIPGGLLGQDGYCFTADEDEPGLLDYLKARLDAALAAARSEAA